MLCRQADGMLQQRGDIEVSGDFLRKQDGVRSREHVNNWTLIGRKAIS